MYCLTMAVAAILRIDERDRKAIAMTEEGTKQGFNMTHTAPLAKTIETPIFFALVICSVQSNGMGMSSSTKSTKMLQKPKMFSTTYDLGAHTVVGATSSLKLNVAANGLQAKHTRSTVTVAHTAMRAPTAQAV